jgi:hypothetical protein
MSSLLHNLSHNARLMLTFHVCPKLITYPYTRSISLSSHSYLLMDLRDMAFKLSLRLRLAAAPTPHTLCARGMLHSSLDQGTIDPRTMPSSADILWPDGFRLTNIRTLIDVDAPKRENDHRYGL